MDTHFDIENVKKESCWDNGESVPSCGDNNVAEHLVDGPLDSAQTNQSSNDKSEIDIPFKDQIEIKQEVSYECEHSSKEIGREWNKAIGDQTNLKLEETHCSTNQNVGQCNDNLKESISDLTDEPVIHVICPENESDSIYDRRNNSQTTRKTFAENKRGYSVCGKKSQIQKRLISPKFGHISEIILHCPNNGCYKRFNRKESLVQHTKCCHMFKCPSCHKIFKPSFNPRADEQEFKFECPACGKKFESVHNVHKFHCPEHCCSESFKDEQSLLEHLKRLHFEPEIFPCPENDCNKTFRQTNYLVRHLNTVHMKSERVQVKLERFHCPENDCNKTFKHKVYLEQHLKTVHVGPERFHCPEKGCSKTFKHNIYLKHHLKTIHVEPETFHCPENGCCKTFKNKHLVYQHRKNVHVEPSYKCTECSKVFKISAHLKTHMFQHKTRH